MSHFAKYTDEDLIKLLNDSNKDAFTELYNRYHKLVYGYLFAQLESPQHTQDMLHEVFMKIWEIRMRLELKSSFTAYLFRICHNKVVDFSRKRATERLFREELKNQYDEMDQYQSASSEEFLRMDNLVEEALDALTPQRRTVFELCRKQGKSYKEVAKELGISPNTVKEHMSKALATLRGFVQKRMQLAVIVFLSDNLF